MVLSMYLGHYFKESVHAKDHATFTFGHICAKYAKTSFI
jgi:D-tyrosyl-tRNA(Tyr) deacylase